MKTPTPSSAVTLKAFGAAAGMCMVAATLPGATVLALTAAAPAAFLVACSLFVRAAATAAVLASIAALALGYPSPLLASLAGIAATTYLLLMYGATAPTGVDTASHRTVACAGLFAVAGLVAVSAPIELAWLPVVAPVAVVLLFALAVLPFNEPRLRDSQNDVRKGR